MNIREEIKKLVQFVSSNNPPLFDSLGALGGADAAGFEDLSNVVDQILCNIEIIRHENACVALDHYILENFYDILKSSRSTLRERYLEVPRGIIGNNPKILSDEKNVKAYHALKDFVFQSLAWWLVHVAKSKSWHAPIIAVLSRWSVKLKLIALDPVSWAEQTLSRGEDTMRRISNKQQDAEKIVVEFPSNGLGTETRKVYFPEDCDPDYQYYYRKIFFRESIYTFVREVLHNLVAENLNTSRSTAFEVRTLIYRGHLDETLRQLIVQQDGSIETSSDPVSLTYSYRALDLLLSDTRNIPPMDMDDSSSKRADIHWHLKRVKCSDPGGSVSTTRLDDVISALVPLSLMGSSELVKRLENALLFEKLNDELLPEAHELFPEELLRIEFSLSTRPETHNQRVGSDMIPMSRSPLSLHQWKVRSVYFVQHCRLERLTNFHRVINVAEELRESNISKESSSEAYLKRNVLRNFEEYKTRKAEIDDWTVTEDSVRVRTTKYSSSVLAIAIAVIGGSLSVPFLVGERIAGVDPFQFATFGWLLAGAFLVGAKSRYIENWDWHDFLRGQIVCRSVSELAEASRVKQRAVLLYLLHQEFRQPLVFRGPYHGVFRQQAKSGAKGFSIDVAVEHATVLAAGFIVQEIRYISKKEPKIYIRLHDTREDAHNDVEGKVLVSDSIEEVRDSKGEKQKSGCKKRVRLKFDTDPSKGLEDLKVLGLPTADFHFI